MAKLTVTWTKEVVSTPTGLVYRVNTRCQTPEDFPSAAVFVLSLRDVYQNVCSFADFIYFLPNPEIWRFNLLNKATELDASYLGKTFTIENTAITGVLQQYSVGKTVICGRNLSSTPPSNGTVIISNGVTELRLPYRGVAEDACYRSSECVVDFADIDSANRHVEVQRGRIITLLTTWSAVSGEFEKEMTEVLQNE